MYTVAQEEEEYTVTHTHTHGRTDKGHVCIANQVVSLVVEREAHDVVLNVGWAVFVCGVGGR
jgi:hypothetical protein